MTERLRDRPRAGRAPTARAHEDYLAGATRSAARAPIQRRRHAGPGEVPARAGRARPGRGPGVNPLGDEAVALPPTRAARHRDPADVAPTEPTCRRDERSDRRVAAVDCGTNSIRLLIADLEPDGRTDRRAPRDADRAARPGRRPHRRALAGGARAHLRRPARVRGADARRTASGRVRMVATRATRDARNRDEFFARPRANWAVVLGVEPEVITGDEEARLSFAGATGELASRRLAPFLVVDIGGGSTEFVLGDGDGVRAAVLGRHRLRAAHRALPAARPADARTRSPRHATSPASGWPRHSAGAGGRAHTWVGVAGTMTTLAAVALDLPEYDSEQVHLSRISRDRNSRRVRPPDRHDPRPARRPRPDAPRPGRRDRRRRHHHRGPGRRAGAPAGIAELIVSEHDILDGIALLIA